MSLETLERIASEFEDVEIPYNLHKTLRWIFEKLRAQEVEIGQLRSIIKKLKGEV